MLESALNGKSKHVETISLEILLCRFFGVTYLEACEDFFTESCRVFYVLYDEAVRVTTLEDFLLPGRVFICYIMRQ